MLGGRGGLVLDDGGVLVHPGLERLKISLATVCDTFLVVFWVEHEGWVSSDLKTLSLVSGGIEFGNNNVWLILEGLTELIPNWSELLAMSTPWGVVLDEDISLWVLNDLLEFFSNNDGDSSGVILWDWGRLESWLKGTGHDVVSELGDGLDGKVGTLNLRLVLVHALWGDRLKHWEVSGGDTHELGELLLDSGGDVGVSEKDFTLVNLGGVGKDSHEGGISVSWSSEEDHEVLLLGENGLNLVLGEFEKGWHHKWLDELKDGILVWLTNVLDGGLLEGSEEGLTWESSSVLGSASGIIDVDEVHLLLGVGESHVAIDEEGLIGSSEVGEEESLVLSDLGLKSVTGDLGGGWAGLLEDVVNNGILGSSTHVFHWDTLLEELHCWETLDTELVSENGLFSGINLGKEKWWVILSENLSSSGVLWGEFLAVTTPWCVEFNEKVIVLSDNLIKVGVSQDDDTFIHLGGGED